jgi:small-conductance mechanosensitive channel/CRP-like cAMP-binding protein
MDGKTFSVLGGTLDPLLMAAAVTVIGFCGSRYWRQRKPSLNVAIQLATFIALTALLLTGGVVPYRPATMITPGSRRIFAGMLEIVWWLVTAWLAAGFIRAFVLLGRKPHEAKLVQDLLAAMIYAVAGFAIAAYVFDLPVKGLLATSGAFAIVIGLALQSSLGDVFSGIVLNIERPYRVGDWVVLDGGVEGRVVETNWRSTHILTASQDLAIIPNSVIAKAKLVNWSAPTRQHGVTLRVRLSPTLTPEAGRSLLEGALLSSAHVLQTPRPAANMKDISAESMDFELSFFVAGLDTLDAAQNEVFDRLYRAVNAVGANFSPRLAGVERPSAAETKRTTVPQRLLAGVSLFSTLTAEEKEHLATQMRRKDYKAGEVVVKAGTVMDALCIVSSGVLVGSIEENGKKLEVIRLASGDYFGELGVLEGEPLHGDATALTRMVVYEVPKEALAPLLAARPGMVKELSESLAKRRAARRTVLDREMHDDEHPDRLADRVAANIRRLFATH